MKSRYKWLLGSVVAVIVMGALTFAFIQGRQELARESEREQPVKTSSRVKRTAEGETVIQLDTAMLKALGVTLAPLVAATQAPQTQAFGAVLDPAPLAALHSELLVAEAALTNSTAQLARTKTLFGEDQNTSRRVLEAAEAQQRTDSAKRLDAQRRWALALGEAGAAVHADTREQWLERLVNRDLVLANVEVPAGEAPIKPIEARVTLTGEDGPFALTLLIYAAPSVDERTRGQSFLLLVEHPRAALRPGAAVTAFLMLSGEPQRGVMLPFAAVVRAGGLARAYVRSGENQFTRREVDTRTPTPDGWFADTGFKPGEQVVVNGAQVLLSEELKSQISVGDEGSKD
jgi:hypothetical protein